MKKSLVLLAILCTVGTVSAQFSLGFRANIATSTTQTDMKELAREAPLEIMNFEVASAERSPSYGLALYSSNEKLFFMTEALYSQSQVNFKLENVLGDFARGSAVKEFSYKTKDIQIPVSAGVKIKNFKIGGGPVFNVRLDNEDTLEGIDNITSQDRNVTTGFAFLVGYELFDLIHIDLKREMTFNRSGENYNYEGKSIKLKSSPSFMSLSVGVFF